MTSTMSILGLFNYDPTLFDDFHIPDQLDKTILVSELLTQCAELEIIYPDPDIMKAVIDKWSSAMRYVWNQLYETTQYDYDPISNYDRNEYWKDSTRTHARSKNKNNDTSTSSRTGMNVDEGMQPIGKGTSDGSSSGTASGDSTSIHNGRISGNIGVTTTQHMIQEQRDIVDFNVYQRIINDFEDRFCIMIY